MKPKQHKNQWIFCNKGLTMVELLVVLVICTIVIAGIYKIFVAQTRLYTAQDQVAGVQQDVRGAMEIMVRDIRMSGFQTNAFNNAAISNTPIVTPLQDNSITVNYQYITGGLYTIQYSLNNGDLIRTINGVPETLLTNVTNLNFSYGIDADGDGTVDGIVNGLVPDTAFKAAASVPANATILAVLVNLTATPAAIDPDVQKMVSPRNLTSVVTLRNMYFKRYQVY